MKRPKWMKNHISCPDCGLIYHGCNSESFVIIKGVKINYNINTKTYVDCPQCKSHYTKREFWEEQHEKWDRHFKPED